MKFKRKSRATKLQRQQRTDAHKVQSGGKFFVCQSLHTVVDVNSSNHSEGIPMKCRQFPKSFWQQPNRPNKNVHEDIVDTRELLHTRTGHIKITSAPDTNLLFSLFKILKQDNDRIVEPCIWESAVTNNIENNKNTINEDEESFKELTCLDDPYMSPKEDCRGLKKSLKSSKNYSELLSDLVVNL